MIRGAFRRQVAPTPHALFRHRSLGPSPAQSVPAHLPFEPSAPVSPAGLPRDACGVVRLPRVRTAPFGVCLVRISSVGLGLRSWSPPPRCCRGTCGTPPSETVAACRVLQTSSTYGLCPRAPCSPPASDAFDLAVSGLSCVLAPSGLRRAVRKRTDEILPPTFIDDRPPCFVALRRRDEPRNLTGSTGRAKDAHQKVAFPSSFSCRTAPCRPNGATKALEDSRRAPRAHPPRGDAAP